MSALHIDLPLRITSMVGWTPPGSGGYEARSSSVSARLSGSACQAAIRRIWPSSSTMSMRQRSAMTGTETWARRSTISR